MSRLPERRGEDLGDLRLAHARLALEQERPAESRAQEDRGGDGAVGDIPTLAERALELIDRERRGGHELN